jgi:hypothetical protein
LESGYRSEEIKNILKETVVHTLLNDQPLFPSRGVGQALYHAMETHEHPGAYQAYGDEPQRVALLKRDAVAVEEAFAGWEKTARAGEVALHDPEGKEKVKGFSHLVNYLG